MDLKSFREDKLKLTQAEFAVLLEVEQSQISRWENNPDSIRLDVIQTILTKTGVTFEELTGWKKPLPEPFKVDNSWFDADFTKCSILDHIANTLTNADIDAEQRHNYLDDLKQGVENIIVKPQLTIVGRSDTGKSTLINALIGLDKMPTSWTPTTSIAIYIKDITDKPPFIEEDVWVFANHVDGEELWDVRRFKERDYCEKWKIGAGGTEILRSFGTRQGDNYGKNAGSAVVFVDAPILKTCDIVDLPGFGSGTKSDDEITFKATQGADVIIYLSQANGFMRQEDIEYLKQNVNQLPIWEKNGENELRPLSNLFVVASQAHVVSGGNRGELNNILDRGCNGLLNSLSEHYWDKRENESGFQYGKNEVRSRFFAYTTDIPDISARFNDELRKVLELLPAVIEKRAKLFVKEYINIRKPNLENELKKYEGMKNNRDKYIECLKEIDANELERVRNNDRQKNEIRTEIENLHDESINEFSNYCSKTINTDNIVALIKSKKIKNKKEDVEQFGSLLLNMLQEKGGDILSTKSKILSEKTKDYIKEYSEIVSRTFVKSSIKIDFDAGWEFASALSKLGLIGGLGGLIYSTISGAIFFTSMGMGIGSSIGFGLLTSSIFGPVGILGGLLIAAGLGIVKLFGGGWEKSVAKKIVKIFEKEQIADEFRQAINNYWTQTKDAFNHAAKTLDEKWAKYVKDLREAVKEYDNDNIKRKIASLKSISYFFDHISL